MIHDWNFEVKNPVFEFKGTKFSVQMFTDSNRYDLDADKCRARGEGERFELVCDGLEWAGGQEKCAGGFELTVTHRGGRLTFEGKGRHTEHIRRVKITLYGQPSGEIVARRLYTRKVSEQGDIFRYPNGWDDLFTPLVNIVTEQGARFYRSLDTRVRPKAFFIKKDGDGSLVEMIFEEDARLASSEITVPPWETGTVSDTDEIYAEQADFVERAYALAPWETRSDVPDWARDIRLVVSLHGMHWSGHIFNTYADMKDKLSWFAERFDPHKTLVYVPGFDGRYYYKYCDYTPDPRMGGPEGFKALVNWAHGKGFHIMPMFMINGAHPDTPGFHFWGEPSRYRGSNGYQLGIGSCDWDTSRGYDLGCGIGLNPGAPLWQNRLVEELTKQIGAYGLDGVFLDLAAIYHNDPMFSTHEGCVEVARRLHEKFPSLLIGTEGWYDALSAVFPFSQCAGQGDSGEMIWHDTPYAPFYHKYNRCFGHLCLGDAAGHRNGVFEWGVNPADNTVPLREGLVPTLTVLDDTVEKGAAELERAIGRAGEYDKLLQDKNDTGRKDDEIERIA